MELKDDRPVVEGLNLIFVRVLMIGWTLSLYILDIWIGYFFFLSKDWIVVDYLKLEPVVLC